MRTSAVNLSVYPAIVFLATLLCLAFSSCERDRSQDILTGDQLHQYVLQQIDQVFEKIPDTVYVQNDVPCECPDYRSVLAKKADTAKTYVGVRQTTSNRGPIVDMFFNDCGVDPGLPWCACFVNYSLLSAGGRGPNGPAWSPSWFPERRLIWRRGDRQHVTFPKGAVIGIYFKSLGRIAHVGIVYEDLGDGRVRTIEGNTNNNGSRTGDGVYFRERDKAQIYAVSDWGY